MKPIKYLLIVGILTFFVFFSFCKKEKDSSNENIPASTKELGVITGKVLSMKQTPISGANVFVDDNGEIYLTQSNVSGDFELEAPIGDQIVNIQTGDGEIFRSTINVKVTKDEEIHILTSSSTLQQASKLAYIKGDYDAIEIIIIDSLGYEATELQISDLDNLATLQEYAAIFLNCTYGINLTTTQSSNLEQFVIEGGSLYASDWAIEYLIGSYDWGKSIIPISRQGLENKSASKSCIEREGGFISESILCSDKVGLTTIINNASIVDENIKTYLGKSTVNVEYDLNNWEVLQLVGPQWDVLIEDTEHGPLAIRLDYGKINNSSKSTKANDPEWVTICHIPPGNPGNAHTITISTNALQAHLNHGDNLGPCAGVGGTIYYTTFHNEVQENISPDIKKLLEYFILNL